MISITLSNRDPLSGFAAFCLVMAPVFYLWGWRALRRRWMITGMPTSKARSVAMGLAELKGKAKPLGPQPRLSPVRKVPCVWSRVVVTEHKNQGKNEHSRKILDQEIREPFVIEDDTGRVAVLPVGAEITGVTLTNMTIGRGAVLPDDILNFCDFNGIPVRNLGMWSNIHYTLKEDAVVADAEIYVLGEAATAVDSVADGRRKSVTERLRAWLKDPAKKAEIDSNRDGIIQQEEWGAAQQKAQDEILREDMEKKPEVSMNQPTAAIRKPRMGFFIIASGTEKEALGAQGYPGILIPLGLAFLGTGIYITPPDSWASGMFWVSILVMLAGSFLGGLNRMLGR